jgi:hypothetical protein
MGIGQHSLNRIGIEGVVLRVVIGGGGHNHHLRASVGLGLVGGGTQSKKALGQKLRHIGVVHRGLAGVEARHSGWVNIQ